MFLVDRVRQGFEIVGVAAQSAGVFRRAVASATMLRG